MNARSEGVMDQFSYQLNYDAETYTVTHYSGADETVTIPESFLGKPVTILFDKLFAGHDEIRSISIPVSVTDLGEFLFDGCVNLHHIELPPHLRYLWGYTFCRSGIEEIVLPDSLRIIPSYAFKDCIRLKRVVCGKGVKKIAAWAFGGCENLTDLVHGPDVEISPQAFAHNRNILEIKY